MKRAARFALVALVAPFALACGRGPAPAAPAPPAGADRPVLSEVVLPALAELEERLGPLVLDAPPDDPELVQEVHGMVSALADGDARTHELVALDLRTRGDAAARVLHALARDEAADEAQRRRALEGLGALDSPLAAEALLQTLEGASSPSLRAHAAWRLGATTQDWAVPRLLLRLKYEVDHDTAIWIARALAGFGNYSGIGALFNVSTSSTDEALRASAGARLAECAALEGFADPRDLWSAWLEGDPAGRLAARERSPRYEREVWRWLARLREFQLRGVDDARFVLEGLDAAGARLCALALADRDVYTRVHAAQSLERMGPRGAPAGAALIAALDDPELAPHAAAALGGLRHAPALPVLAERAERSADPELRLAATRALGRFAGDVGPEIHAALRRLLAGSDPELRQAAAESLVYLGQGDDLVRELCGWMTSGTLEPVTSERAVEFWLSQRAARDPRAEPLLERWNALGVPSDPYLPPQRKRVSRAERAALVLDGIDELLGSQP